MIVSRRTLLEAAGFVIAASSVPLWATAATDNPLYVQASTAQGKLRGMVVGESHVFKGIPYAQIAGRLQPPVACTPWNDVRDAFEFGPRAWQPDAGLREAPAARVMSEHCQVLNVWTPALDAAKRPVMVWLHGGGFTSGSASRGDVEGAELSHAHDVVVVTLNHRLGAFGYLYLGDSLGEKYGNTSLAGTLDMVAALKWVRDNIAGFGGDPGNVTIFGVSGGGGKVMTLMTMPAAAGLFHRGIVQSGTLDRNAATPEEALRLTHGLLRELGANAAQARAILDAPADKLLAAQAAIQKRSGFSEAKATFIRPFSPVIDAVNLPGQPFYPVAPAVSSRVPLMVGTCREETRIFHSASPQRYSLPASDLRKNLLPIMGDRTDEAIRLYSTTRPGASPSDLFFALSTAQMYWAGLVRTAEIKAKQVASVSTAAPVFVYEYAYDSGQYVANSKIPLGAAHSSEVPLIFNHPRPVPGTDQPTAENVRVALQLSGMWAAFARSGSPNGPGLPRWPAYSLTDRAVMRLDADSTLVHDPDAQEREWWQRHGQVKGVQGG